jgi:hypothetical protein
MLQNDPFGNRRCLFCVSVLGEMKKLALAVEEGKTI